MKEGIIEEAFWNKGILESRLIGKGAYEIGGILGKGVTKERV